MSHVHVLAPDVIAKIAAGEAVDRPAAVVKELLENALDADATSIDIHLKDAGKELIHLRDNGSGISKDNLEKIFQRHATSKITSIDDLEKLSSMGFRGEALYSIAAVSDVILTTGTAAQDGWQIHWRAGARQNLQPAALSAAGTDIRVAELFFNTPARRKFLKNNTSELHQILNVVMPYALIYPRLRLGLTHMGRSLLDLKPAASAIDRAAAALNVNMEHWLECDQEYPQEKVRVKMILGNINMQRPRRDLQFIFINNRPVESRNLSFNLNDVYKLILPPGVCGAFIVNIMLDPANVDVNIHPTKREVRLKDEARIISLLRRMTEYQLMQKGRPKQLAPSLESGLPAELSFPHAFSGSSSQTHAGALNPDTRMTVSPIKPSGDDKMDSLPLDFQLFGQDDTLRSQFTRARFIGHFLQKFLIFEANQSLLIVDQHAAQERIMFEKFKNQLAKAAVETQPLLTPLLVRLTPQEKMTWEEVHDKMASMGIETTRFDDDTIAVQTQPLLFKNMEAVVRSLLAGDDVPRMDPDSLARRACKASIVAGDKLDASQADYQRRQLLECRDPFTCPHGRPTLIEVTQDFLDRRFLRA